ncbi:SurA N-terminal domain-containing protein [Candidatus Woesearchaeota archaeon]|nr:SurA N-terminal domain-containing protein [Candidatus Woesearchaeota archaeon]
MPEKKEEAKPKQGPEKNIPEEKKKKEGEKKDSKSRESTEKNSPEEKTKKEGEKKDSKSRESTEKNSPEEKTKKEEASSKKNTLKKIFTVIVLVAILALILNLAFKTLKPGKAVATVNGEVITGQELEQKYGQLPEQYKLFIPEEEFLDQLINTKLLLQEAESQAVVVSEGDIKEELDFLKMQAPTDEAFEELLKQQGISMEELKVQINEQLMISRLLNQTVVSHIEVSDSKIRQYYQNNLDYFNKSGTSYEEAEEQIRQILLGELSESSINLYISQLRAAADISIEGAKAPKEIETFTKTGNPICREGGKAIIRMFSTSKNKNSEWISQTFRSLAEENQDRVVAYHWQLDTGDNLLTPVNEEGIPRSEVELFQRYNPKNTVPTYVFGCRYVRVGNPYSSLKEEKAEFERVIEKI